MGFFFKSIWCILGDFFGEINFFWVRGFLLKIVLCLGIRVYVSFFMLVLIFYLVYIYVGFVFVVIVFEILYVCYFLLGLEDVIFLI